LQTALELSLKEIRSISAGLRLPELEELSPEAVARRAVRDYQRKTKRFANLLIEDIPKQASMPVKITLYRVLQEALFNGFRHADGKDQVVRIWGNNKKLHFEVSDNGTGFEVQSVSNSSNLGLSGMRERVEVLGGTFDINSSNDHGTHINVTHPLEAIEDL